jgi:MFS family permease
VPNVVREPSYRALLRVPLLGRVLLSMQLARIAQTMVGIAIVLFTLARYRSPALTGVVTFLGIAPGLLVSPIAGALLDRHGRIRLMILDYVIALGAMALIGVLAIVDALPAWLLILIVATASLTNPLSATGLRSIFPLLVPPDLWERVNALDSNGYIVASIIGPPIAAGMVAIVGAPATLIAIGLLFGAAAVALIGAPDPRPATLASGSILRDAWVGLQYTWRNPTLRGLGASVSILSLSGGMTWIVVPILVLDHLKLGEAAVGWVFAASGIAGIIAASVAGRLDTRGREWALLVWPTLAQAAAVALLLATENLVFIVLSMALAGLIAGPFDIAMFTIRQRRTDPALLGRAYAVSMSLNFSGFPVGSAIAGLLIASWSIQAAIAFGIAACLASALLAATLIPKSAPEVGMTERAPGL